MACPDSPDCQALQVSLKHVGTKCVRRHQLNSVNLFDIFNFYLNQFIVKLNQNLMRLRTGVSDDGTL